MGTLTDLGGTADQPAHHLPPPPGHGIQGHPHHLQDRRQERRGFTQDFAWAYRRGVWDPEGSREA